MKTIRFEFQRAIILVAAGTLFVVMPHSMFEQRASSAQGPGAAQRRKFQVEEATIATIQDAILARELTATGLVKLYLARIQAYNGPAVVETHGVLGPMKTIPHAKGINALSTLNLRPATRAAWGFDDRKARSLTAVADDAPDMPDALEVAAKLDAQFAQTGKLAGPLHGVVMAIKDQYDTFDMRTTSGADAFYANDRPPHDATFVARLRAAGAIILAKSNASEYAGVIPRSSFGGTFANPYDTERNPGISSSGSGSAVGANLVTVSIAEETGSSIRGPAYMNNSVGLAPTQELVSRHGMIQMGIQTRVGPIARTVEDLARILTVIAGYDPKDPLTAFSVGRMPDKPYEAYTRDPSLKGLRIGVVREYMDKKLFPKAGEENIDVINRAVEELKKLGATVVDPGDGGELFTAYIRQLNPALMNANYTRQFPEMFPVDADGKPTGDHIATLVDLAVNPAKAAGKFTLRDLGGNLPAGPGVAPNGEGRYTMNLYLRDRGDATIKTLTDLHTRARFYNDPPAFPSRKPAFEDSDKVMALDMAARMHRRFAVQQIILQAFGDLNLDAVVYPTSNLPPPKLGAPVEPTLHGADRGNVWSLMATQGFPALTVPAGFTTRVYDRVRDPKAGAGDNGEPTILIGPTAAKLPVGMDIVGRPFSEATLIRIAAAYEKATLHRTPPPDFGPLTGRNDTRQIP